MIAFLMQHQVAVGIVAYWLFSAAVSAMPPTDPKGQSGYAWLYQFLHTIAGNLATAFSSKIPGVKS